MVRSRLFTLATLLTATLIGSVTSPLAAQACYGTPNRGGVAYEFGQQSGVGTSHGINAALARGRTAWGLSARARAMEDDISGQDAQLRFSLTLPVSRVRVCPGLALAYSRDQWDAPHDASITSHNLGGRVGAGVGLEQEILGGVSVIPFVVAQYEFLVTYFDTDIPSGEVDASGDTLSHGQFEYGLVARYRFVYAGIAAHRTSDQGGARPYMARFFVGYAFGARGSSRSSSATRRIR